MKFCLEHSVRAKYCPLCVLRQLATKGGSPLTAGIIDDINEYPNLPQDVVIFNYWQREAKRLIPGYELQIMYVSS